MISEQVPIFVINLDTCPERLERVAARLSSLGLTYERVSAVNGRELSKEEKQKVSPERSWLPLSDAEIGCYMSHLKAIRLVAERELPRAIILEDDAVFEEDFALWASRDCPLPRYTDILKLEGFGAKNTKKIPIWIYENRTLQFSYKPTGGAAAYLITLDGARKALQKLDIMKAQLDTDLFAYWKFGFRVYEVAPFPARQEGGASTIDHRKGKRSMRMKVERYFLKSFDKAGRLYCSVKWFGLGALVKAKRA